MTRPRRHASLPPDHVQLIRIGPSQAAALTRLFTRSAGTDTARQFDPFPLNEQTARMIAQRPHADLYFAGESNGELIGMTMLRGWEEGYETPSFGILVDRAHRGRGVGRRMTELTIEQARAAGCARVRLSVYASNRRAHGLYQRLGFVERERTPTVVAGNRDERVLLTLDLRSPSDPRENSEAPSE